MDERTSKIDGVVEKPNKDVAPSNFTIMGRYILKPEIFTFLEENNVDTATNEIQITDSIEKLSKISDVLSYEFDAIRYDMGSVEGFVKAQIEFSLRDKNLSESIKNIIKKTN
ncbi:MAG: hypothetical protein DRP42_05545 [Tenericutes bacterium]|nr:MAG: hypothetical protein DRP42_05545 [Mycoplasmatota bacterium]